MPKGKPKAKFGQLYQDEEEDEDDRSQRQAAPQAAPHKRGGTHRLKEEHRTGTHWDNMNLAELKAAAMDRGVYKKDMPKHELIRALANKDDEDAMDARRAKREAEQRKVELEARKKREEAEKERRRKEELERRKDKVAKRQQGEDVSNSESESERKAAAQLNDSVGVGNLLDDDTDSSDYTTATNSTHAAYSPMFSTDSLRIGEWSYADTPLSEPPPPPISPSGRMKSAEEMAWEPKELLPKRIPYISLSVITTVSHETIQLPGKDYSEDVGPGFVPPLSEHLKNCARNGVLNDALAGAVIESGADWATRTLVQWWNGKMFFDLARKKSKAQLQDVYKKWKQRKIVTRRIRRKALAAGIRKPEPKKLMEQRLKEQRQKLSDVCAASEFRPKIAYLPSYLGYPLFDPRDEEGKSMDNLFYIRFPHADVPHYLFWADPEEWADPRTPNPEWLELTEQQDVDMHSNEGASGNANRTFMRVKRTPVPRKFLPTTTPPNTSRYKAALWHFERELYHKGWARTMYDCRETWTKEGKGNLWSYVTRLLPRVFPSGRLPDTPPIRQKPDLPCIAEKLARVEVMSDNRPLLPIFGTEDWTRDDDAYWVTVEQRQDSSDGEEDAAEALSRRTSEVYSWMDTPGMSSPDTPSTTSSTFSGSSSRRAVKWREWKKRFMQAVEADMEQQLVTKLRGKPYKVEGRRRRSSSVSRDHCGVCLEQLGDTEADTYEAHMKIHRREIGKACPFCNMPWTGFNTEMKAAHIFQHEEDDEGYASAQGRRRSTSTSSPTRVLAAVPKFKRGTKRKLEVKVQTPTGAPPRRISKVKFSPVTVEKRVAYNGIDDEKAVDGLVSSMATMSPWRASWGRQALRNANKTPRKSALKVDTSGPRKRARLHRQTSEPSTLHTGPEPPVRRRIKSTHPDATWDLQRHPSSASDRTPSPYLPQVKRYPFGHPKAAWDPRKASNSSLESLEFNRTRRRPKTQKTAVDETINSGKGKRKIDAANYVDAPSNTTSYDVTRVPEKRRKPKAPSSIHNRPAKRPKTNSSALQIGEMPQALENLTPMRNADRRISSTISNASSASDRRRRISAQGGNELYAVFTRPSENRKSYEWTSTQTSRLASLTSSAIPPRSKRIPLSSRRSSAPPATTATTSRSWGMPPQDPTAAKKRRASYTEFLNHSKTRSARVSAPYTMLSSSSQVSPQMQTQTQKRKADGGAAAVLDRRSSAIQFLQDDYIPFATEEDVGAFKDLREDVVGGNPFAAPPAKKRKGADRAKATGRGKQGSKKMAGEVAFEAPKTTKAKQLQERRRTAKTAKTTILNEPPVEPLVLASAKRPTRSNNPSTPQPIPPAPPSNSQPLHLDHDHSRNRGRRSSAPTPSPSLLSAASTRRASTSTTATHSAYSPAQLGAALAKRKASYDVPFSEVGPIVPPNTPAVGILGRGVYRGEDDGDAGDVSEMALDLMLLGERIGGVERDRRGRVDAKVRGKGKTRGKAKERGVNGTGGKVTKVMNVEGKSIGVPAAKSRKRKKMSEVEALAGTRGPMEKKHSKKVGKTVSKKRNRAAP